MADEAHKEPTMEEILSSIRKIISEDEVPGDEPVATPTEELPSFAVDDAVNDDFEDLTFDDVAENAEASVADDFEEEDIFEVETSFDEDTFEVEAGTPQPADLAVDGDFEPDIVIDEEPEVVVPADPEPVAIEDTQPQTTPAEEPAMSAAAQIDRSALTDTTTADAAAGALGQLFSKMEISGDNTIEGLVREMLKPMIKDWLDANLQGIVESKVEAEVARIARMAR